MKEIAIALLTTLLGGGIGAAIVVAVNERWKMKFQRNADKEDRAEAKADKLKEINTQFAASQEEEEKRNEKLEGRLKGIETQLNGQSKAMQLILLDRILWLGQSYIDDGEISFDDRRRLRMMHDCYHDTLKGNGDADLIMDGVDHLPLKHGESDNHAD